MYKNLIRFLGLITLLSFTAFVWTDLANWKIQDNYEVYFEGRGATGTFSGLQGKVVFDPDNLSTANMDVSVDVATISTGNSTKDKHARGESWFDAKKYPKIKFKSKRFKTSKMGYDVVGDLTLHGVTKEITIPFTFEQQADGGVFSGNLTIDRTAYGIDGPFISFTVASELDVKLRVPVSI